MTWSIVAREPETGRLGVGVSTCYFAVGAISPFVESGVAALSIQSLLNPFYAIDGLRLLRDRVSPAEVVARLTALDAGAHMRQWHIIDIAGRIAQHTGTGCIEWSGHVSGADCSVAGNMLAGPLVVQATADRFAATRGLPMAERLLQALAAGEAAGGDKRGRQSAAIKVFGAEPYAELDIRVDDHADPLGELRRLYAKSKEHFAIYRSLMPTRLDPAGTYDRAVLDAAVARARGRKD